MHLNWIEIVEILLNIYSFFPYISGRFIIQRMTV